MNVGQLMDVLEKYERHTEVVISLGSDESELRRLGGIREGKLIEEAKSIQHKSSQAVFYPHPTMELPSVAVLLG